MVDESEGTAKPDQMSIEAATKVLKDAGLNVLPQAAFARIKADAAASAAAEAAQARAELERVNAEFAKASERLKAIDDKGKSADDIWRERQAEWTRQLEAKDSEAKAEKAARLSKETAVKGLFRDKILQEVIAPNATSAEAARAAHLLALTQFPTLSTNDSGVLTYVDPAGVEHVGDDAAKIVNEWWGSQKWAHRAPSPGPTTKGGSSVAASASAGPVYPPSATPYERSMIAAQWEESQRIAGRKR